MLKFCMQYLVAAHYGFDLLYATNEDNKFKNRYIMNFLKSRHTISTLHDYIINNVSQLQRYS